MAEIISGKEIAKSLKEKMHQQVAAYEQQYGRVPRLVVVLVGDDAGSVSYVKGKSKAASEVGIDNETILKSSDISQEELLSIITQLNEDDTVDGILVQLPLPKHIDEKAVLDAISPQKDVDGFHPLNVAALWLNQDPVVPCTPQGVMRILEYKGVELAGRNVVVVGRSNIVGLPVSKLLLNANATVTIAHSRTKNLAEVTSKADVLVVAVGRPRLVTGDMVKPGAVVIDVGVNRDPVSGKLCGDCDFDSVEPVASMLTPVPGGVGPMTITCLMENTIKLFLKKQ